VRRPQKQRLLFPLGIWIVLALWIGVSIGLLSSEVVGDHALANVLVFVATAVTALVVGLWFVFFGPGRRGARLGVVALVVVALALFSALFRVEGFGGEMLPSFRWRFGARTDLPEARTAGSGETADLTAVGPFDFPGFLGPERSAAVDFVTLARDWGAEPPERLWRQPIGEGWSGFAVVGGYAVTQEQRGERELVTCYAVESGELVWSTATEGRYELLIAGTGPRATPTIAGGRVFAQTALGTLLALDGSSGEILWRHDLSAEYGLTPEEETATVVYGRAASPLVTGTKVIVPAGGAEGRRRSLVAFDAATGELLWEGGDEQLSYASPAVATLVGREQVLVMNEDSVAGHDPATGAELWSFPRPGRTGADPNASQPVPVPPDRVFVSKGYGLGAALLSLTEDDPIDVEEVWASRRALRTKFTNVAVFEGHVYGLSDGILECVALETGERVWKRGRYHHGQILRVRDLLLVLSEDGELVLVDTDPAGDGRVLGRFQALEGKTWNTLALRRDVLLVRNAEEAAAYRLPLVE